MGVLNLLNLAPSQNASPTDSLSLAWPTMPWIVQLRKDMATIGINEQ
jgi:hypothetical protein